jgi:hypothetical protein
MNAITQIGRPVKPGELCCMIARHIAPLVRNEARGIAFNHTSYSDAFCHLWREAWACGSGFLADQDVDALADFVHRRLTAEIDRQSDLNSRIAEALERHHHAA